MKSIRFGIVILFLAVIQLSYCTNAVADKDQKALERAHFSPYNGKQQDWPISTKPILDIQNANTKHGVPIYRDLPGKPYVIIGIIKPGTHDALKHAVEAAHAVGADAILCADDKAFADLGVNPHMTMRGSESSKVEFLEGILIRWKSPSSQSPPPPPAPSSTPAPPSSVPPEP